MGYASFMEDIIDRLTDDFNSLKRSLSGSPGKRKRSPEENQQHALKLLNLCEQTIQELNRNLDLVTDPALDFPARVQELEEITTVQERTIRQFQSLIALRDTERTRNRVVWC